jgi:hypothetical protein
LHIGGSSSFHEPELCICSPFPIGIPGKLGACPRRIFTGVHGKPRIWTCPLMGTICRAKKKIKKLLQFAVYSL